MDEPNHGPTQSKSILPNVCGINAGLRILGLPDSDDTRSKRVAERKHRAEAWNPDVLAKKV